MCNIVYSLVFLIYLNYRDIIYIYEKKIPIVCLKLYLGTFQLEISLNILFFGGRYVENYENFHAFSILNICFGRNFKNCFRNGNDNWLIPYIMVNPIIQFSLP